MTTVSVIGTGYLGATHAAAMAELGFDVIGVDVDQRKIDALSGGELPFFEPGLPELLKKHIASGRLRFTTSIAEAANAAQVHFIAVGTPQRAGETAADVSYVDAAVLDLGALIEGPALIVGKSTVPVGTARRLAAELREVARDGSSVELAWNPEFLREGFAVEDTLRPDRIVIGAESDFAVDTLKHIYNDALQRETPFIVTDFETAELVKVAANAFLATKISFINALSEITETVGGSIGTLAEALGHDVRIGRKFLNAGVGFGGGCLPKDIRALQARASELGLERSTRFLSEMDEINLRRRDRVVFLADQMLHSSLEGKKIAVLGASFKPNSDDVRDSPALDVAARLFNEGANVYIYDPQANENARARFPRLEYVMSTAEAVQEADLVIVLTEWSEFRDLEPADLAGLVAEKRLIDGRNIFNYETWSKAGWEFAQLGLKR